MAERARILIIEDSSTMRAMLKHHLCELGFETEEAADGASGVEAARTLGPDLILCDLRMPGMDGLQVIERVHDDWPDMPIIVVSGSEEMDDAVQALKFGAWDYLIKPLTDIAVLDHAIERSLERAALLEENEEYRRHLETMNAELAENLRQLQEDEEAGRRVQFELMPPSEELVGGLAFARAILPSSYLSGDFVDWFAIDGDRVGFYVADVSGHGVSSAFVTVLVKSFIDQRLEAWHGGREDTVLKPAELLAGLNRRVLDSHMSKSLTLFYGVVDTTRGALTYGNAGHFPYPILRDAEGARYLRDKGFGVGHFDFATYQEHQLDLPERWSLVVASDGLFEVMEAPSVKGREAQLLDIARATPSGGLQPGDILAAVGHDPAHERVDDVTLLIVREAVGES